MPPALFASANAASMPIFMPCPSAPAGPPSAAAWPNTILLAETPSSAAAGEPLASTAQHAAKRAVRERARIEITFSRGDGDSVTTERRHAVAPPGHESTGLFQVENHFSPTNLSKPLRTSASLRPTTIRYNYAP